jgi:zinc transport system ATP-binding protein
VQIYGEDTKSHNAGIGYVPQLAILDRRFPITVLEVVLTGTLKAGLTPFHRYKGEQKDRAREILKQVGIEALSGRQISELSGGEFQRMLIARALAVEPKLLLLDEPTASVDAASREQIYELLGNLNQKMTIVLVTHDLLAVSSQIRRLACLNGRLVYHGEPELNQDVVNHLYGCPVDLIAHGVPHRVLKEHEGDEHEC